MAEYRLTSSPDKVWSIFEIGYIYDSTSDQNWQVYQEWLAEGNTPAPALPTEQEEAFDLNLRQTARYTELQTGFVKLFKLLLAIYQVGVANGAWVAGDFDQEIRDQAQRWNNIIQDYENEV